MSFKVIQYEDLPEDLEQPAVGERYKAPPVECVWIDKEGGKKRPIG